MITNVGNVFFLYFFICSQLIYPFFPTASVETNKIKGIFSLLNMAMQFHKKIENASSIVISISFLFFGILKFFSKRCGS